MTVRCRVCRGKADRFEPSHRVEVAACGRCGQSTTSGLCAFCKLSDIAKGAQ